ncbi:D-alanyl-D-alanine carboxypeptidase family protein [Geminocystis sp. GBBB08]|uniref:M15 family metallopeptidase n=1 Tax=Geminocystis sp. GBBB08 TaxID=2604140 RepID=UPI0027E31409|nr:D-alanyl-D-alanine carboxypeptidase family protein [Geminocystis sp. GBBB08]MBL1208551.1 D-alanyl-D-alanine carboxypeptidase family protein [Geminocystis sp. GBBB08]
MDEIPVALREAKKSVVKSNSIAIHIVNIIIIATTIGLLTLVVLFFYRNPESPQIKNKNSVSETPNNSNSPITIPDNSLSTENSEGKRLDNILGHLPYKQAPQSELKSITSDGSIKLRQKAADKFLQMQRDARTQGVILTPISGFRSVKDQEYLFFKVKEQRKQVTSKRAEVSAPPGYSEHHTGYALDIGDGNVPATNLNTNFENTAAYKWLKENAPQYSFELSFPQDNLQGISYEPWHWRFVGDTDSLETFYQSRQLTTKINR